MGFRVTRKLEDRCTDGHGQQRPACVCAQNTWSALPRLRTVTGRFEKADSLNCLMHEFLHEGPHLSPQQPQKVDGEGGQGYLPCLRDFWLQLLVELAEVIY